MKELLRLYNEPYGVRRSIRDDIEDHECFFDENAYADYYDIDGHKVLGILTETKDAREYDETTGIIGSHVMQFICKRSDVKRVPVNTIMKIDGKAYYVTEARVTQGMYWKISLRTNG